jgi:hypothetical protein
VDGPAGRARREPPAVVTIVGRVEQGVEHRSVVLRGDDGRTWQIGAAGAGSVGLRVRVLARPLPGLLTTAMQGVPVHVLDLTVLQDAGGDAAAR